MAKSRKKGSTPPSSTESIDDVSVAQPGFAPESHSQAAAAPQSRGDTSAASDDRERIAMRAYELYLARGRGEGAAMEDWLRAEQELTNRSRSSSPDPSRE
jgi:hypothetical protein